MKKVVKKKLIHDVFIIMNTAKLGGLKTNDEKTNVLIVLRNIRPIALQYEERVKDAIERLKTNDYDEKIRKAMLYEHEISTNKAQTSITEKEYEEYKNLFDDYNKSLKEVVSAEDNEDVEVELEQISVDTLEQLMSLNDWSVSQYFVVESLLA